MDQQQRRRETKEPRAHAVGRSVGFLLLHRPTRALFGVGKERDEEEEEEEGDCRRAFR